MSQTDLLGWIAHRLTTAKIPFMVVGSLCSSYHGEPRFTRDADVIIDPTPAQLDHLLALFAQGGEAIYVSPEAARDALRTRHQFNVIDTAGGFKADLIFRKQRPFDNEEFQRRQTVSWHGQPMPMATAEDVILAKLEWNKIGPSEQQVTDVLKVAIAQWQRLDQHYLRKWAHALEVTDQLEVILRQASDAQG
jgi:hypothetical protein